MICGVVQPNLTNLGVCKAMKYCTSEVVQNKPILSGEVLTLPKHLICTGLDMEWQGLRDLIEPSYQDQNGLLIRSRSMSSSGHVSYTWVVYISMSILEVSWTEKDGPIDDSNQGKNLPNLERCEFFISPKSCRCLLHIEKTPRSIC